MEVLILAKKNEKNKVVTKAKAPEVLYSRSEIIEAAYSLGELPETIAGALSLSEKDELSRSEVEQLIKKFKTRKV